MFFSCALIFIFGLKRLGLVKKIFRKNLLKIQFQKIHYHFLNKAYSSSKKRFISRSISLRKTKEKYFLRPKIHNGIQNRKEKKMTRWIIEFAGWVTVIVGLLIAATAI